MSIAIKEQKKALRKEFKYKRSLMDTHTKELLDRKICSNILSLDCFLSADTVLMYSPVKGEIDLTALSEEAFKLGKKVAFPLCNTKDTTMTYKYVSSLSELTLGSYSIPEPKDSAESFSNGERAICIVPALSFDKKGFRLGYGKGYYDRFLKDFNGISVGVVYCEFLSDSLPRGRYDLAVDILISEEGNVKSNDS